MTPTASPWTRRHFLGAMAAASMPLPQMHLEIIEPQPPKEGISLHVFSKHLQFLDYKAMADMAAEIGFDGVDLTVRPGGHVLPENVPRDLPKAVEAIKQNGLQATMMTTAIINAADATSRKVLETASKLGIRYYRTNWLRYEEDANIPQAMEQYKKQLKALAGLNQQWDIYGSYQNHSGSHYVGAPVWDIALMLRDLQSKHLGSQYDIRHATVEGGLSWPLGLNLIHPHINTIVIKDCRWEQQDGQWKVVNTPIGEGMVDFKQYFSQLKSYGLAVPVSLHFEYDMPENDTRLSETEKRKKTVAIMQKDLNAVKQYLSDAGL